MFPGSPTSTETSSSSSSRSGFPRARTRRISCPCTSTARILTTRSSSPRTCAGSRRSAASRRRVADVRPIGVEQSNSSVVVDEQFVLKVYRRLEAGPNPELELLRALEGGGVPARTAPGGRARARERAAGCGAGRRHRARAGGRRWLGADARRPGRWRHRVAPAPRTPPRRGDRRDAHGARRLRRPSLGPEEPSSEAIPLLAATVDEEIERLAAEVPELAETGLAARLETVRDLVHDLGMSARRAS